MKQLNLPKFDYDFFTTRISTFQDILGPFAGQKDLTFLEIGSFEGRSALWLLEHILTDPSSSLVCVDHWDGFACSASKGYEVKNCQERFIENISEHKDRVRVLRAKSAIALAMLKEEECLFDFIYIDGSHVEEDVFLDAVMAWPLLRFGGTILFDDYGEAQVARAISRFRNSVAGSLKLSHSGYQVAFKKEN